MKLHKIELTGYCAKSPEGPALYLGTAGSYGNEQLAVTLGKGWDGLTVTATFQPAGVTVLVPGDGTLDVPWEATETALDAAKGRIVFEGVTDGRVLISTDIPYAVGSHSDTEGSNSQPPTPSQWEQFVDEVKGNAERAEQAAKDAEAALQDVKDTGAQAVTDIGAAKDSALDAIAKAGEEAAGSITADVQAAKDAAAAAAQSAKDAAAELPKVQQAGQTALDDIATERENSLTALEDEGGKQQSAVAGAGASALEAIQQAGQSVTGQITQTGATQVGAVQSAGTTQVGLVNSAGQQQAENIAQAGSQQVQAVQTAGTEAVGTVNDARDDAVEEIETANAHAPQINPTTGYWQTWDTEAGQYVDTTTKAQGATPQLTIGTVITLEPDEDATVAITGPAEAPVLNFGIPKGEPGDTGTSGSDLPATTAADRGKAPTVNAAGTGYELTGPYAPLSAAIIETAKGNPAVCEDSVEWGLQGMRVYGKSTQDGIPSPENPVPIVSAGDEGSVSITLSDGGDQSQTLSWDTPNGLPGIPVDSGGNFVDTTSQEWICDYRDWARGVDVKRCNMLSFTSQTNWRLYNSVDVNYSGLCVYAYNADPNILSEKSVGICDWFVFKNWSWSIDEEGIFSFSVGNVYFNVPKDVATTVEEWKAFLQDKTLTVVYSNTHVVPIETPILADELTAYRALHTYDGATVVTPDDALAEVEVDYIVKPKAYIEKKLTAIEQKIQEVAAAQIDTQTGG